LWQGIFLWIRGLQFAALAGISVFPLDSGMSDFQPQRVTLKEFVDAARNDNQVKDFGLA
jgi:hypothetical protein